MSTLLNEISGSLFSSKYIHKEVNNAFEELSLLLKKYFAREESRLNVIAYIRALLSATERKNSWQLSEEAGLQNPYAFQYLLGRARWDADELRDENRAYTFKNLSAKETILALDETGFLKKGNKSAGVGRQYSGTAGRIENCQVGVFLSYATKQGRALIDRELYIPQEWFKDKKRCEEADIPVEVTFKTKPELARQMLERTFKNGFKADWVLGDEVYGCYGLRAWLEEEKQPYILAVASNYCVTKGFNHHSVKSLLENVRTRMWKKLSAGKGSKGERYYEWYRMQINSISPKGFARWLLIRRNIKNNADVAYYIAFSPLKVSLEAMAKAAGSRWTIEECFEMAKGEVGLDQYEVRSFVGWYRHITLSMIALSFLSRLRPKFNEKELKLDQKKIRRKSSMNNFLLGRGLN